MTKVLFAGSFNPYTIGHHSVYLNACKVFGDVHIGITQNPHKKTVNANVTKWITNAAFHGFESSNVKVVDTKLLVDFAEQNNYKCLVRSLRNSIDLVHEIDAATWNSNISEQNLPTVFVPSDKSLDHVSSSAIRELDLLGKDMGGFLVNDIQYNRWKNGKPKRVIVCGPMGGGKSSFIKDYGDSMVGSHLAEFSVDMDQYVKEKMNAETANVFKQFFKHFDVSEIAEAWEKNTNLQFFKKEVAHIVKSKLDKDGGGLAEISAFTAYKDLEEYYNDSIIVYVRHYTNGKKRDIDPVLKYKSNEIKKMPKVVDFVVDVNVNVEEITQRIRWTMNG